MTSYPLNLQARTLHNLPRGESVKRIISAALNTVDPAQVIPRRTRKTGDTLIVMDQEIDLDRYGRIFLLAAGKAALPMAVSTADVIGKQLTTGLILTKKGDHNLPEKYLDRMHLYTGGHPLPDQAGQGATAEILTGLESLKEDDLVIVLISGGSSALLTHPAPGISLADLQQTNQALLACGADIVEINTIRKHLSQVKGGQLAKKLHPAEICTLILSDVIGDRPDLIGSGPTIPDPSTYQDALAIIDHHQLKGELPEAVISWLQQGLHGKHPETPKPDDPIFRKTTYHILANNQEALQAGADQAAKEGFSADTLPGFLTGEAREAGQKLAKIIREIALNDRPLPRPACLIAGGETTVTLSSTKQPGAGGRNLETALSALPLLDGMENIALITLATDGEDGPTNAAGAVVTGTSLDRCRHQGLDPGDYLKKHDSYTLFKTLDDLLVTGPTGTNVNDLCFLFAF